MITEGMTITITDKVTEANTAKALGSGSLDVYATPAMILLIERAAVTLLEGNLDSGMSSVGTRLDVEHVAPSPVGSEITCQVTLKEIDRRNLTFSVEVRDQFDEIGRGTHCRFIITPDRFMKKAATRL